MEDQELRKRLRSPEKYKNIPLEDIPLSAYKSRK
jgi:hypothetical protein